MIPNNAVFKAPSRLFYKTIGNRILAIDQKTLGWAFLSIKTSKRLKFLSSGKTFQEALSKEISKEEIEEFLNAGLLKVNGAKKRISTIIPVVNTGWKLAILHTSNACNLRCTYCYSNATKGNPMSSEVAISTIDKLAKHNHGESCLEFHGGEPLLHFDFLKSTITYANTKKLKDGKPAFSYSIQTNATLINDEKAKFLKDNRFEVGISIDGPKEENDKNRVFKNGEGTYDHIIKGIRTLKKNGVNFGALITIKDLNIIDKVYDFMLERGINHIKFGEYFKQGRALDSSEIIDNMKGYAYKTLELIDKLAEYNLENENQLRFSNASVMLHNILTSQRKYMCVRFPCGAGDTVMGIDTDGSVYPCEEMNGKLELKVGNIVTDSLEDIIRSPINIKLRTRKIEDYDSCKDCSVVSMCEVSCPNQSYNKSQRFNSKTDKCEYYKIIIPELMVRVNDNPSGMATLI